MNKFKVANPRKDLELEIRFTDTYRRVVAQYAHPAQVELACIRAQYPAVMHPIEDTDLLAGRIQMGLVGLGIQQQTGGFGYYMDEDAMVARLENAGGNARYREAIHDMLTFWKARSTTAVVARETPPDIKRAIFSDHWKVLPLPGSPIYRMAGSYPDFDKLVRIGIPGLRAEIAAHREKAAQSGGDMVLFESMLGAVDVLRDMCLWYALQALAAAEAAADPERRQQLRDLHQALTHIAGHAPQTFLQGLQLVWLYGVMVPQLEFGRMDIYMGDLYAGDIDAGRITQQQALQQLVSFYRLIDSLDCEMDGRVIVGGYGRRNPQNADRFCLLAIEASRVYREVLPQFTLRFHRETAKEVMEAARQEIAEGRSYPLMYNDDVLVPGVQKAFGVSRELAERYVPLGCGEIELDHYSFGTPSGSLNALKILETTIHGGFDPVMQWQKAPVCKKLADCETFEEFYSVYKEQLRYYIHAQAKFERYEYDITGRIHPFMMCTMLYDGCLARGKGIFAGGCALLGGTLEVYGGINAANSLVAIKKLVYDEKKLTAPQLVQALDANFAGHELERRMMMDAPKWGNDDAFADAMVVDYFKYLHQTIREQAPLVGLDSYLAVTINNQQNTTCGRWVGATPDGRKAGTPMANANGPASGTDTNGVTALLNSLRKMPSDDHAGMVQNVRFSRETLSAAPEKVWSVIDGYFAGGGMQAMITVVGREDLAGAMERPEEYRDLIVRVGGFSARFVTLEKDVQQELFDRATY
ncbi:MAG: hypothetical protein LBU67_01450 [Oscillospiraceae bacterium]|jgi:pyruvate-formate lyase|nr:hypothetical protein [Oscillospiraceae bacterium]